MSINDGKHLSLEDRMHIETNIIKEKEKLKKRSEPADYTDRKYEGAEFVKNNPCSPTTEMDTVCNNQDGPLKHLYLKTLGL